MQAFIIDLFDLNLIVKDDKFCFRFFFVAVPSLSDLMCHCAKEQTPRANECMNMRFFLERDTRLQVFSDCLLMRK